MAIVKTMDIFPVSCVCVVCVWFLCSTERKGSYGDQSIIWYSPPNFQYFFIFPNYVHSIFIVDVKGVFFNTRSTYVSNHISKYLDSFISIFGVVEIIFILMSLNWSLLSHVKKQYFLYTPMHSIILLNFP